MPNPKTQNLDLDLIDRTSPDTTYLNLQTNLDDNWKKIDAALPIHSMVRQAIINGNFSIPQRGTSFTNPANITFTLDRYRVSMVPDGGTFPNVTHAMQALTPGDIEKSFDYYRISVDGPGAALGNESYYQVTQAIEHGVRYLCGTGKKVTLSFFARSSIPNKRMGIAAQQVYGSGGSPSPIEVLVGSALTLTSTWTKYSVVFDTNSILGKTFGTINPDYLRVDFWPVWGSAFQGRFGASTTETFGAAGTIDIAQVQLCAGDVALPFQPRSTAEELMLCLRYYEKSYDFAVPPGTATLNGALTGITEDGTNGGVHYGYIPLRVRKRTAPTVTIYGTDGTVNTVNDETADRALGAGFLGTGFECIIRQDYTLIGATSRRRRYHYTAESEI